jgi:hemerythrin-like domain-containing protein
MTSADNPHNEMNTIIHHGLRRDLSRLAQVLQQPVGDAQRQGVARHTEWMLDTLHHHHTGEDEGVWPRTLAKRPDLQPLVDQMEAEHAALSAASDELRAAAEAFGRDGSEATREAFAAAVQHMQETTLPHLEHEEQVAMPLVLATLDDADWAYLEKHHFRAGMSLSDEGKMLMWLLDDLDDRRARMVRGEVPRPMMWLIDRRYGGTYDREASVRWGGLARARG